MITVVVPHQLDKSKPYLDLCLKALQRTEEVEFEVIVVSGAETDPILPRDPRFTLITDRSKVGVSAKLGLVCPEFQRATHLALVSDDVMVSKYMLSDMVRAFANREMIMNPMSNSDCYSMYEAELYLRDKDNCIKRIYPDIEIQDMTDVIEDTNDGFNHIPVGNKWIDSVIEYPRGNKCLVPFQTVSFYCTMIPISVWNKVGNLDPHMEYRHNDQDYCLRAAKLGIPSVVNMGAFAFHFGSKTMRHMANDATKLECSEYFRKKWMTGPRAPEDSL